MLIVSLAVGALMAQAGGLVSLFGFSRDRADWDARGAMRAELALEVESLQARGSQGRAKLDRTKESLQSETNDLAEARARLAIVLKERDEALKARDAAAARLGTIEATQNELSSRVATARKDRDDLAARTRTLRSEEESLRRDVERLRDERAPLEKQRADRMRLSTELSDLSAKLSELRQSVGREQRREQSAKLAADAAAANERQARDTANRLNSDASAVTGLKAELEDLLGERNELRDEVGQLKKQRKRLQAERRELPGLSGQKAALERDIAELNSSIDVLKNRRSDLQARTDTLEKLKDDLDVRVKALGEQRDAIRGMRDSANQALIQGVEELDGVVTSLIAAWKALSLAQAEAQEAKKLPGDGSKEPPAKKGDDR